MDGGLKKAGKYAYNSTDRLREKRTRGGEGVKKAKKSAYVLYGCSLIGLANARARERRRITSTAPPHTSILPFYRAHSSRRTDKSGGGDHEN